MLGSIYSSSSDFSLFSHSRDLFSSQGFCLEQHETAIEERYCPNHHFPGVIDDKDWDRLVAHEARLFDNLENEVQPMLHLGEDQMQALPLTLPSSPLSRPYLDLLDTGYYADEDTDFGLPPSLTPSPVTSTFSEDVYQLPSTPVSTIFPHESQDQDQAATQLRKRARTSNAKPNMPRKRLCRASSTTSVSTDSSSHSSSSSSSSVASTSASAPLSIPSASSSNPWKCPHCTWIQHTRRLPDFLRHQRSHFVSESDWPCPNPKCGKGFARKDSLKRHLDNRATGCRRPSGYSVC